MKTALAALVAVALLSLAASAADMKMPATAGEQPAAQPPAKKPAPTAKEKLFRDFLRYQKKK